MSDILPTQTTSTPPAPAPEPTLSPPQTSPEETATHGAVPTATITAEAPAPASLPETAPAEPTPVDTNETISPAPQPAAAPSEPTPAPAAPVAEPTPIVPASEKPAAVDEPQNTLTKRFTEAEWKALKDFRADLPEIFADGFPDDTNGKDKIIRFWGVEIDPHNPTADARVSVILMKFLRARNLNVTEARDMFVETLRWRESFGLDKVIEETFPEDVFGHVGYVSGHDKENRPVVYNFYGVPNVKDVFSDVQRFLRWRVQLQEKSIALLNFIDTDQMIQIHDYEGASLTSRDANSKNAASEATSIFQGHYPELLYKKFFVNVPTLMNWIFWLFKPLISANTLAKMSVVGTGHHALKKALLPYIDEKQLPQRYGGEAAEK